ncbi:MAG: hypothetical protein WCT49_05890 [Candidatus Paceibacterota bacterium]|jgi:hypothetical protein|nr:hypothetical protein [Candidatus Paceibacterota bacterium]
MSSDEKKRLRKHAYHEAGHAVMARLLNLPVDHVYMNNTSGGVYYSDETVKHINEALATGTRLGEWIIPHILVLTAGKTAENIFSIQNRRSRSAEGDDQQILKFHARLSECSSLPVIGIADFFTLAYEMLDRRDNRGRIKKVAHALFTHRKLSGTDLEKIYSS